LPNLEGEDDGGMRAGRRRKDARSILAVNRVERADVKTAARLTRARTRWLDWSQR
jgi:hypothetical protein